MSNEIKKVFIDGGAHIGESVDLFFELYPDAKEYEIHSFEPNPDNHAQYIELAELYAGMYDRLNPVFSGLADVNNTGGKASV